MQIIDNRGNPKINFCDLQITSHFLSNGKLYVKTDISRWTNAFDFETSQAASFNPEDEVEFVPAESITITINPVVPAKSAKKGKKI